MKKGIILLLIILLMSGCYDYVEIDDLVIISGMVIDYKDNKYEISSQIIENEAKTKVKVYTTTCNTIDECIFKLSKLSNKDIFISHLKVLILTENTINNKKDYYDYFLRDTKSKMNFFVYYADSKYAKDILNIYKEDNGSALYIKDLMTFNNKIFSSSSPLSFLDLMFKIKEPGIDPIYPNIVIQNNNEEKVLYLENLIAFDNKGKKIILNENNGIMYNILTNKLYKTVIDIPCDNKNFSIVIDNSNTKYHLNKNTIYLTVKTKSKISSYSCKYDLDNPKNIDKLSNLANKYLKKEINKLIDIQDNNDIDFLGLGLNIYKHNKKLFKSNEKYKTIINVDTTINSIGEIR